MATTNKDVEVLVKGKPVEFSFRVLKNGGAVIGLKQKALDTKARKTTKKAAKKEAKTPAIVDGVRFEENEAIIRIGGKDVETIAKPNVAKAQKPMKQWKTAINSNLWNVQGGNENEGDNPIWAHKVTYGDMPTA